MIAIILSTNRIKDVNVTVLLRIFKRISSSFHKENSKRHELGKFIVQCVNEVVSFLFAISDFKISSINIRPRNVDCLYPLREQYDNDAHRIEQIAECTCKVAR